MICFIQKHFLKILVLLSIPYCMSVNAVMIPVFDQEKRVEVSRQVVSLFTRLATKNFQENNSLLPSTIFPFLRVSEEQIGKCVALLAELAKTLYFLLPEKMEQVKKDILQNITRSDLLLITCIAYGVDHLLFQEEEKRIPQQLLSFLKSLYDRLPKDCELQKEWPLVSLVIDIADALGITRREYMSLTGETEKAFMIGETILRL